MWSRRLKSDKNIPMFPQEVKVVKVVIPSPISDGCFSSLREATQILHRSPLCLNRFLLRVSRVCNLESRGMEVEGTNGIFRREGRRDGSIRNEREGRRRGRGDRGTGGGREDGKGRWVSVRRWGWEASVWVKVHRLARIFPESSLRWSLKAAGSWIGIATFFHQLWHRNTEVTLHYSVAEFQINMCQ